MVIATPSPIPVIEVDRSGITAGQETRIAGVGVG